MHRWPDAGRGKRRLSHALQMEAGGTSRRRAPVMRPASSTRISTRTASRLRARGTPASSAPCFRRPEAGSGGGG
eukprot:3526482-Alexandrium_andersonii.AAC.1